MLLKLPLENRKSKILASNNQGIKLAMHIFNWEIDSHPLKISKLGFSTPLKILGLGLFFTKTGARQAQARSAGDGARRFW